MNNVQKKKLFGVICIVILVSLATCLILFALKQNINLFYTPTELLTVSQPEKQTIRLGGYVKKQSVHYKLNGDQVEFVVTDRVHDIRVLYAGILPNLFREGQVVVVTGKLNPEHTLIAAEVLAKHDEKYIPREIAKELQRGSKV